MGLLRLALSHQWSKSQASTAWSIRKTKSWSSKWILAAAFVLCLSYTSLHPAARQDISGKGVRVWHDRNIEKAWRELVMPIIFDKSLLLLVSHPQWGMRVAFSLSYIANIQWLISSRDPIPVLPSLWWAPLVPSPVWFSGADELFVFSTSKEHFWKHSCL